MSFTQSHPLAQISWNHWRTIRDILVPTGGPMADQFGSTFYISRQTKHTKKMNWEGQTLKTSYSSWADLQTLYLFFILLNEPGLFRLSRSSLLTSLDCVCMPWSQGGSDHIGEQHKFLRMWVDVNSSSRVVHFHTFSWHLCYCNPVYFDTNTRPLHHRIHLSELPYHL